MRDIYTLCRVCNRAIVLVSEDFLVYWRHFYHADHVGVPKKPFLYRTPANAKLPTPLTRGHLRLVEGQ